MPVTKKRVRRNYLYAVGRRKSATSRVRYYKKGEGKFLINEKEVKDYFPTESLQKLVLTPLEKTRQKLEGNITIKVQGGGKKGQAESVRHGLARILVLLDEKHKKILKKAGLLTRDARIKERKKPGLKKARRAPQWSKR